MLWSVAEENGISHRLLFLCTAHFFAARWEFMNRKRFQVEKREADEKFLFFLLLKRIFLIKIAILELFNRKKRENFFTFDVISFNHEQFHLMTSLVTFLLN
jgi:hypothetical protein